jgi:hypothetical protein
MTVIAVVLAGVFLRAGAADAAFIAETRDPTGDSTEAEPARDLLGAGIGFDQKSGYMVGIIALRGSPNEDSRAFLSVYAAMRTANGCSGLPAAGFGAFTDGWGATWFRQQSSNRASHGEADKSGYRSTVQRFEIRDKRLSGKKWDCLGAVLTDPDDPSIVYDEVRATRFKGLPALALKMPKVRRAIPPNRVRKLRIVIRNPGDGPLRNVRLKVLRARGLKAVPRVRKIGLIRPRTRRAVIVRVRLSRAAREKTDLKVQVRSGKLKASAKTTVRLKLPKRPPANDGGGGDTGSGVCVQYFPDLSGETGGSLGLVPC